METLHLTNTRKFIERLNLSTHKGQLLDASQITYRKHLSQETGLILSRTNSKTHQRNKHTTKGVPESNGMTDTVHTVPKMPPRVGPDRRPPISPLTMCGETKLNSISVSLHRDIFRDSLSDITRLLLFPVPPSWFIGVTSSYSLQQSWGNCFQEVLGFRVFASSLTSLLKSMDCGQ